MAIPRNLANIAPHVNASSTELVVNDGGANLDFRVEGDTNANLLVADAGAGKVGFGTNTFNTNGGVIQVSNGISFPATQSACSDVNTLDDYEEGTWTPTLGGLTTNPSSITYANQTGTYTKVGNIVSVNFNLHTTAISGGSGAILIQGLPFSCANSGIDIGTAYVYNLLLSPIGSLWTRFETASSTTLYIEFARNDNTPAGLTIADWPTSKLALVRGNMTYRV